MPSISGQESTATVPALMLRTTLAASSRSPTTGTPATSVAVDSYGRQAATTWRPWCGSRRSSLISCLTAGSWPTATTLDMHWP